MELHIKKDQAKKLLGGIKFELTTRVVITQEERALIERFKAYNEVLLARQMKIPFTDKAIQINLTISSLTAENTRTCDNIQEILEWENAIKEACDYFYNYLQAMKEFGGEEVISWPRPE